MKRYNVIRTCKWCKENYPTLYMWKKSPPECNSCWEVRNVVECHKKLVRKMLKELK